MSIFYSQVVRPGGPLTSGPMFPRARFIGTPNGLVVQFQDQSDDSRVGGTINTWSWNFGDGSGPSVLQHPSHQYATTGQYLVTLTVGDNQGLVSQAQALITVATSVPKGILFGWFRMFNNTAATPIPEVQRASFNCTQDFTAYNNQGGSEPHIISRIKGIRALRAAGYPDFVGVLAGTGGPHEWYITGTNFDLEKWKHGPAAGGPANTGMDGYTSPTLWEGKTIVQWVQEAAQAGEIMWNLMDEPQHSTWGSTTSKPVIDQMWQYVRDIFGPDLIIGVGAVWYWRTALDPPVQYYQKVQFIFNQFEYDFGPTGVGGQANTPERFRDDSLAWQADERAHSADQKAPAICFCNNPLDGGPRVAGCPLTGGQTLGPGTFGANCMQTALQYKQANLVLGPAGVGMMNWEIHAAPNNVMTRADYQQASADIKAVLDQVPKKPWTRS